SRNSRRNKKNCASNRIQSARRWEASTTRNGKDWNGAEPISTARTNSSTDNNSKLSKCNVSTTNNPRSCRSASKKNNRRRRRRRRKNQRRAGNPPAQSNNARTLTGQGVSAGQSASL